MIKNENLIFKQNGKRTLILRDNSEERLSNDLECANFMNTGLALVAITKKYETPEALINRINGMKTHFLKSADSAISLHNKARNEMYKQKKTV